jgi:hypothetical protein
MKVIINPRGNILYKSFYIKGLETIFGVNNVSYSDSPFVELSNTSRNTNDLLFVVLNENTTRRYFISTDDSYKIKKEIYILATMRMQKMNLKLYTHIHQKHI